MTPYFQSPERQLALQDAAQKWIGTPFMPHTATPGTGIDCVRLAEQLYLDTGALTNPLSFPTYTLDHARHSTTPQLLRYLLNEPQFKNRLLLSPPLAPLLPGDLLAIKVGHVDHHLAIILTTQGKLIHATHLNGACLDHTSNTRLRSHLLYIMRLHEANPTS